MKIQGAALFQEMQAYAQQARQLSTDIQPIGVQTPNSSQSDFAGLLKTAINSVNGLQSQTSKLQTAVEMGDPSVSLAQAMIASQKSSIAFEATVQVRNKLVEAYKEVMSMPV